MVTVTTERDRAARLPVPRRGHLLVLACAWTIFAVYGSLVPLRYRHVELSVAIEQFRNLPPLWVGMGTRADWVANILLFVPLTFFWMGAICCDRGRVIRWFAGPLLALVASVAAVALEFTQIWFAGRTVGRNDIVAETIGGLAGVALWLWMGERLVASARAFMIDRQPRSTLQRLLAAYVIGLAVYSVIPLDLTISLTDLYDKYRRGLVLLVPFGYQDDAPMTVVYQFFADIVTFMPIGAWIVLARSVRAGVRSPFVEGLVLGGVISVAIEFAQLLVISRFTDTTDILLGSVGAGTGAWLMTRIDGVPARETTRPSGRADLREAAMWLAALAGYSLFLVIGFWYPFEWTDNRALIHARDEGFFRVPLLALYQGSEFNAIKQFLVRLLLFAPLGVITGRVAALVPQTLARAAMTLVGLGYAAALATGLEAAQIFMPSKIADSTEVVICFAGAVAGLLATRRVLTPAPPRTPVPPAALPSGEADAQARGRNRLRRRVSRPG